MNSPKEIFTTLLTAGTPLSLNIAQVSDLLTAAAAFLSIGFTIYRAITAKKTKKDGNAKKEK